MCSSEHQDSSEFTELSKRFFALDAYDKELDLFCSLAQLEPDQGWAKSCRDRLFSTFYRNIPPWTGRRHRPAEQVETWKNRLEAWERHLDALLWIKQGKERNPGQSAPPFDAGAHGTNRADILFDHLKILDSKFSMLMGVNAVLVALVGVSLKETTELLDHIHVAGVTWLFTVKWTGFSFLVALLMLTVLHAFFNFWYGIRGFRRVVWGDLSSCDNLISAERQHARFLIFSLARRTCVFRVVSESTRRAYRSFVIFAVLAGLVLSVATYGTVTDDLKTFHKSDGAIKVPVRPSADPTTGAKTEHPGTVAVNRRKTNRGVKRFSRTSRSHLCCMLLSKCNQSATEGETTKRR